MEGEGAWGEAEGFAYGKPPCVILLAGFTREAEEDEEEDSGEWHAPTYDFHEDRKQLVEVQPKLGDIGDPIPIRMHILPRMPRLNGRFEKIVYEKRHRHRENEQNLDRSKRHETHVSVEIEAVPLRLQKFVKAGPSHKEGPDRED